MSSVMSGWGSSLRLGSKRSVQKSSGASGEDGGEFGLDYCSSTSLDTYGELPEIKFSNGVRNLYGSVTGKAGDVLNVDIPMDLAERMPKVYTQTQQIMAIVIIVFLLFSTCQRLFFAATHADPNGKSGAPSPAPGAWSSVPTCAAYTYPQCEPAILWYLSQNAKSRCEAFERVKAEGDLTKFPYSTQQDTCSEAGCCGCPGQCSKCPPLLPECNSWRLDGSWKVAFADGSEARYTFDAHGHCEVELSASALPTTWKDFDHTYIAQGSDTVTPGWMTLASAKKQCDQLPECMGITYDATTRTGEQYYVYLKSTAALTPGPGTAWKTMTEEKRPELHGSAAVAGALTQVSSDAPGTFRFDLHKAAPQLFPVGSMEHFTVSGDELQVERRLTGAKMLAGAGVRAK